MRLWRWARQAYGRPGVADLCLALQDGHGQSVCLLLWAAWARPGDAGLVAQGAGLAQAWEADVLAPLRAARRGLKPARRPVPDVAREALRTKVKAAELGAERLLLEALERLAPHPAAPAPVGEALARACEAWGRPAPAETLAALARALE